MNKNLKVYKKILVMKQQKEKFSSLYGDFGENRHGEIYQDFYILQEDEVALSRKDELF